MYSGCNNNYNYTNKEYAYQFTATSSGTVTVQLTNVSADLDVGVLDAAGGCKGSSCIVWGDNSVTFSAVAGKSYYLVVDGYNGVQGSFNIHVNCGTVTESNCVDNIDNDSDGQIDCADSDCNGFPACGTPPSESNCTDSWDNDSDGKTDCDDPDCAISSPCDDLPDENDAVVCADGIDNDQDGQPDCMDADCRRLPVCRGDAVIPEATVAQCQDGQDNDGDERVDCDDTSCRWVRCSCDAGGSTARRSASGVTANTSRLRLPPSSTIFPTCASPSSATTRRATCLPSPKRSSASRSGSPPSSSGRPKRHCPKPNLTRNGS